MNMRKKTMIAVMLLTGLVSVHAGDYSYLTFQTTDGKQTSVAVESLTLTIAGGNLVATDGTATQTFELASLSKMFFASQAMSAAGVKAEDEGTVSVCNVSGTTAGQYSSEAEALSRLPGGVYILKSKGETRKIVKP
jgi:hypothetical protein